MWGWLGGRAFIGTQVQHFPLNFSGGGSGLRESLRVEPGWRLGPEPSDVVEALASGKPFASGEVSMGCGWGRCAARRETGVFLVAEAEDSGGAS